MAWHLTIHPKALIEINDLPTDMRAKLARILEMFERLGPFNLKEPHVKSLKSKLMEIRLSGASGISRVIYVVRQGQNIMLLHAFVKKTQKTPALALACALRRMKDIQDD